MPGTTTHNWVLYKALQNHSSSWGPTQRVQASNEAARAYGKLARGAKPSNTDNLVFAGCAYLGACGPDLFYLDLGSTGCFIADLLHYNRTAPYMLWWLSELKKSVKRLESSSLGDDLLQQYAYCLGHISHIAADITMHPYVDSIVQAYPLNEKVFENSRGMVVFNLWKFHNVLEHHQDSYILHEKFFGEEGFNAEDWENANVARHASNWFRTADSKTRFIVDNSRKFYRYSKKYGPELELDKHKFFMSDNYFLNLSTYYDATIPDRETMRKHASLVQKELFDEYVNASVAKACEMYEELERYMRDSSVPADDPELRAAKALLPNLRRHWNLDCGMAPAGTSDSPGWDLPGRPDRKMCISGALVFDAANGTTARADVRFPYEQQQSSANQPAREEMGGYRRGGGAF